MMMVMRSSEIGKGKSSNDDDDVIINGEYSDVL